MSFILQYIFRRNVKLVGCVQIAIPLQQSIPMTLLKFRFLVFCSIFYHPLSYLSLFFSMESVFILGSMLLVFFSFFHFLFI